MCPVEESLFGYILDIKNPFLSNQKLRSFPWTPVPALTYMSKIDLMTAPCRNPHIQKICRRETVIEWAQFNGVPWETIYNGSKIKVAYTHIANTPSNFQLQWAIVLITVFISICIARLIRVVEVPLRLHLCQVFIQVVNVGAVPVPI